MADVFMQQIVSAGAIFTIATLVMRVRAIQWRFGIGEWLLYIAAASLMLWLLLYGLQRNL